MPMRCTPWPEQGAVSDNSSGWGRAWRVVPGKKRAVLGREVAVVVEAHLLQLDLHNGAIILCRVQKALPRRLGQQLPNLPRQQVSIECFIL